MIDPDPSVLKPDPSDKRSSCPDVSLPDEKKSSPVERFLDKHPDAHTWNVPKRQWGTRDDITCAQWIWGGVLLRCMNTQPVMMVRFLAPESQTGRHGLTMSG